MATVTHIIYSHYNPNDRERLEAETGQIDPQDEIDADEEWRIQTTISGQRRTRLPPRFVPATTTYDPWSSTPTTAATGTKIEDNARGDTLSQWYRSISKTQASVATTSHHPKQLPNGPPHLDKSAQHPKSYRGRDWFIQNALSSRPDSPVASAPPPTLHEMLIRHPPPLPSEPKFKQPVWLALGPTNKGFAMLQQKGWHEGEPLGPSIPRDRKAADPQDGELFDDASRKDVLTERIQRSVAVKLEQTDNDNFVEVIDLTVSEDEDSGSMVEADDGEDSTPTAMPPADEDLLGGRTALITPIATTLKADRLGIGLKAKTEGPYHVSKKRITHNKAALAAHIQAAERLRKQKQEIGRGYRSFARASKRESTARQQMIAYMNS
ncbi:hypothetical protein PLEOSDRAFT_1090093 [Pleurotus ostreatus PC15]|uniref:G-patch domain-containing protein n=1 Tax=Pleurotus ostreatus (strain PC15) TaxID=1137138 RepID=A0A067NF31_PLEO1|nr:hypothetical protein PLEOSDRAFT_1090093 [Pleurotus ostreatus PC15]